MIWLILAALANTHPDLMPEEDGCERWLGTAEGNDPSVRLQMRLCGDQEVTGHVLWSSLRSGWNKREVAGRWNGDTLTLEDVQIVDERPNEPWYFCTVDVWRLMRNGTELDGTFVASECDDEAAVHLTQMAERPVDGSAGGPGVASAEETPPSPGPAGPTPAPAPGGDQGGSWLCSAASASGSLGWLLLLGMRRDQRDTEISNQA